MKDVESSFRELLQQSPALARQGKVASRDPCVSMSTSHDQGALLYVVSRSGKVLRSEDRSQRFVEGDYFEGELEGWIFWGSSKRISGSKPHQDAFATGIESKGIGNPFESLGRVSWKKRIPFVVWGDEADSLHNVLSPLSWRQIRKNMARRRNDETWKNTNLVFEASLSGCFESGEPFPSEHWYRMEKNFKIGLSQLAILQKLDLGSRWDPGTRELAARWAAWLLKMLRKNRRRPLQHLLFTMCSAALPVICCSLVSQQWTTAPDQELCRCVDIVWRALDKSFACFTPAQWEILEERLIECQQLRMKVGNLADMDLEGGGPMESFEGSPYRTGMQPKHGGMSNPSWRSSEEPHQSCYISRDQQLSRNLLHREGVSALVERALQEKLFTPRSGLVDGKGVPGVSSGSGTIVSLVCPLSGRRVKVPARGRGCRHPAIFDLQSFLEEHVKSDSHRHSSVHQKKKTKTEIGPWCCPICGSDATWPQLVVDKGLLRILEVLPQHMPQVCLLPNGRWHVVWSPVVEDSGKTDAKLTKVALHPTFKSTMNSDMYTIGQLGELRHNRFLDEEAYGCQEVQILHRAYKAWKGVDDDLAKDHNTEQIEMQWAAESTVAVWTGDHNSSRDSFWQASLRNLLNLGDRVKTEITQSVNNEKAESRFHVVDDVAKISEAESKAKQEIHEREVDIRIASRHSMYEEKAESWPLVVDDVVKKEIRAGEEDIQIGSRNMVYDGKAESQSHAVPDVAKVPEGESKAKQEIHAGQDDIQIASKNMYEALQAIGGIKSGHDGTGGMYARVRVGQYKARPKLMAKKT